MADRALILADGTIIENGNAGLSDGFLWLWIPGWTMAEVAMKVFNPSIMGTVYFKLGDESENVFTGFTVCKHMMQNDGEIAVCMVKG